MPQYSDFIAYVDESGDHGLATIDPTYPIFVLAFCIFEKASYANIVTPQVQQLKFKWFGHDIVVLHERDIRRAAGPFSFLTDSTKRPAFMADIDSLVTNSPFTLIATALRKDWLVAKYRRPFDPYHLSMQFCLERLHRFLVARMQDKPITVVVVEQRGKKEDSALELEFRRICGGQNYKQEKFNFELIFAPKTINSCGLQFADLVARPIGNKRLHVTQKHQTFDNIIKPKFDRGAGGGVDGFGLKCFP